MRGIVCRLSAEQARVLEVRGARLKKRLARIRKHYIEEALKKERRREILKMMEKESQRWMYYDNVDNGIKNTILIPNNLLYQTDYFVKLQERALMVSIGKYDEIEESRISNRMHQYKNSKLIPIYANLTSLLTKLRENDLERLYEEFELAVYGLKEVGYSESEFIQKEAELSKFYEILIMKLKKDMNQKTVKLKLIEDKLLLIYNVLILWREYTGLLSMTYEDFEGLIYQDQKK